VGAQSQESEDLVNSTLSIAGVEVGLFFQELPPDRVKVSFRSREGVDVRRVAEQFGGGGHRQAAGATIAGTLPEVMDRVLSLVASVRS
jgi:phosphoesterase RecJ-like protein